MLIHFEGTFNTDLWLIEIQAIKATFDNGTNRPLLKKKTYVHTRLSYSHHRMSYQLCRWDRICDDHPCNWWVLLQTQTYPRNLKHPDHREWTYCRLWNGLPHHGWSMYIPPADARNWMSYKGNREVIKLCHDMASRISASGKTKRTTTTITWGNNHLKALGKCFGRWGCG